MKFTHLLLICLLLGSFGAGEAGAAPNQPQVVQVNTLVDEQDGSCEDGDCALRDAIAVVPTGASIEFAVSGTIQLDGAELGPVAINKSLKLLGPGRDVLTISGEGKSRLFTIGSSTTLSVTIRDLTLANGVAENGGAIYNQGVLTLERLTIKNNTASEYGGGVYNRYNYGRLEVKQTTFLNNQAKYGGGLENESARAEVVNTTFKGNIASERGGGMDNSQKPGYSPSTVVIKHSTFSENTNGGVTNPGSATTALNTIIAGNINYDCLHNFDPASSYNLSTSDVCYPGFRISLLPYLNLAWQGWVYELQTGSSAIDAGTNIGCLSIDQLDNSRPQDGDGDGTEVCDVGAFEAAAPPPPAVRLFLPLVISR